MTGDEGWTWKFAPRAADQFDGLDHHVQDRIVSKLDEVVNSEWRAPEDFLEPLTGGPFSKLRVGQYRLACVAEYDASVLEVHRIEDPNRIETSLRSVLQGSKILRGHHLFLTSTCRRMMGAVGLGHSA